MLTIAQMAKANKAIGEYWFTKDTFAFFNTKVVVNPNAFNLFLTSETNPEGFTGYTVRLFKYHSSKVSTIGPFNKLSQHKAEKLMSSITEALRTMGNREQAVFDSLLTVSESDLGPDCYEFSNGESSFTVRNGRIVN